MCEGRYEKWPVRALPMARGRWRWSLGRLIADGASAGVSVDSGAGGKREGQL